jgi:hypothetical protein
LHAGHIYSDLLDRLVELGLTTTCDEDISAFGDELLCCSKTNSCTAARDECNFPFEFLGVISLLNTASTLHRLANANSYA